MLVLEANLVRFGFIIESYRTLSEPKPDSVLEMSSALPLSLKSSRVDLSNEVYH